MRQRPQVAASVGESWTGHRRQRTAAVETSLGQPIVPSVVIDDIEGPTNTLLVSGGFRV